MLSVPLRKAAHHQQNQIEHYLHENQLLAERNDLLSRENQRLLEEVEACHDALHERDIVKAGKIISDLAGVRGVIGEEV